MIFFSFKKLLVICLSVVIEATKLRLTNNAQPVWQTKCRFCIRFTNDILERMSEREREGREQKKKKKKQ